MIEKHDSFLVSHFSVCVIESLQSCAVHEGVAPGWANRRAFGPTPANNGSQPPKTCVYPILFNLCN